MPSPNLFEPGVGQAARADESSEGVLGEKLARMEGRQDDWPTTTGKDVPDVEAAILPWRLPAETTNVTVGVPSVDKAVEGIIKHGGKVMVPKAAVPGLGWLAYCQDPEGNVFGVMQQDQSAG